MRMMMMIPSAVEITEAANMLTKKEKGILLLTCHRKREKL
jgi:hypothetical protein